MRYLITGAGIAVVLLCSSCSLTRNLKAYAEWKQSRSEYQAIDFQANSKLVTEYLGDSLTGRLPLPYMVPRSSTWQIQSGGITMDVTLKDSTLEYRTVAKPVARSTLSKSDTVRSETRAVEESSVIQITTEEKKRVGLPWWIWPILALVVILVILKMFNKIKLPF